MTATATSTMATTARASAEPPEEPPEELELPDEPELVPPLVRHELDVPPPPLPPGPASWRPLARQEPARWPSLAGPPRHRPGGPEGDPSDPRSPEIWI